MRVKIGRCCWAVLLSAVPLGAQEPAMVQHVEKGEWYASRGRIDLAVEEYEKAMAAGAGSAAFLNRLGELYALNRNFDQALVVLHQSLREDPGQLSVYADLGEIFVAIGQLDSAIFYVQQAYRLAPELASIHASLGFLYLQTGENARARAHLDTALRIEPNNLEAHRYLGYYFSQVDSVERSLAHYRRLIELAPDHFEAYNNIAFLLAQQGKYAEALAYYEKAKERTSDAELIYQINARMEALQAILAGKMRARYILLRTQEEAVDLRQRLEAGEDFAELARQFSLGPNAKDGGDVDFFGPGELLPIFEETVLQLKVGQISEVVRLPMGYMIIQRLN